MKWILFRTAPYYQGVNMTRDFGALTTGFREIGEEAEYALLDSGLKVVDQFVSTVSNDDALDPEWWRAQPAPVVIMMAGGCRMRRYYEAVKKGGKRLFLRMDTSGIYSPSQEFWTVAYTKSVFLVDRLPLKYRLLGILLGYPIGFAKASLTRLLAGKFDARLLSTFDLADALLIESQDAVNSTAFFSIKRGFAALSAKLHHIPPAVCPGANIGDFPKKNQIVSVGAWLYYVKNTELLCASLRKCLHTHSEWQAVIVGPGHEVVLALIKNFPQSIRERCLVYPTLERSEVDALYRDSKILFSSSRKEGFPNVAAEAACFGCTVVGRKEISAFQHFANNGCGAVAKAYSPVGMAAALDNEISSWEAGKLSAIKIIATARNLYAASSVAQRILALNSSSS